jgi:hypothetical protein
MIGRDMIAATKSYVETEVPGAELVYGDSVTGATPTTVRVAGLVYVETFERLADRWGGGKWLACLDDGRTGKESCELPGVDVWTEEGWSPVRRVIRHLLAPEKRILHVLTHAGMVDATDDHSLLDAHGRAVSARDVGPGFELLHAQYPALGDAEPSRAPNEARAMGVSSGEIVPAAILNASIEVRRAFWHGLSEADGDVVHIDWKNQVSIASYALLASSLGYSTSFDTRADEPDAFRLTLTERAQSRNANAVKRVVEVEYEGWVYDLTTENHHFAAGAGRLVVHNTDSVMVRVPPALLPGDAVEAVQKVKAAMAVGRRMAAGATARLFKTPISLEYEKVYSPFILVSKKRYGGLKYEEEGREPGVDTKGLDLVRRDRIPLARELQGRILDLILHQRDVHAAVAACRETAENLLAGRIRADRLVLSKQLKKEYKSVQPHVVVTEMIRERHPGSEPRAGDRVPFVYLDVGNPKAKTTDMAEDPAYAEERGLALNYEYYLTNCLVRPLATILDMFVAHGKAEDILFGDIIRKYKMKRAGDRPLEAFFRPIEPRTVPKRKWKDM